MLNQESGWAKGRVKQRVGFITLAMVYNTNNHMMFQMKVWNYHGGVLGLTVAGYYKVQPLPYLYKPYPLPSPKENGRSGRDNHAKDGTKPPILCYVILYYGMLQYRIGSYSIAYSML